jgi:hypothetical protein
MMMTVQVAHAVVACSKAPLLTVPPPSMKPKLFPFLSSPASHQGPLSKEPLRYGRFDE